MADALRLWVATTPTSELVTISVVLTVVSALLFAVVWLDTLPERDVDDRATPSERGLW